MAPRKRPRPPGPPYVVGLEVDELKRMIDSVDRWADDVFRQHPVTAGYVLRLANYAKRLLPPRITEGGADTA